MKKIKENMIEILLLGGLFAICLASFLVSIILGLYTLGAILFGFSIILIKFPKGKR